MKEDELTYPFWLGDASPDGTRRLGLSETWLESQGIENVVAVELVPAGTALHAGDALGLLHTASRAHDLRAPAAMTIVRVNPDVLANPALARRSPYGRGWLVEAGMISR
jgi:glycine cleavage system H protein